MESKSSLTNEKILAPISTESESRSSYEYNNYGCEANQEIYNYFLRKLIHYFQ